MTKSLRAVSIRSSRDQISLNEQRHFDDTMVFKLDIVGLFNSFFVVLRRQGVGG